MKNSIQCFNDRDNESIGIMSISFIDINMRIRIMECLDYTRPGGELVENYKVGQDEEENGDC